MEPSIEVYTINTVIATRGVYFNDLNYYIPVYMGTLKHLEESWGAAGVSLGMLTWYSTGYSLIRTDLNITHQIPVSGVTITNETTTVLVGDTVTVTYSVTPSDADIASVTYMSNDPDKASFADSTDPVMSINSPGSFTVTVQVTDILGNVVQTNKTFAAELDIQPLTMSFTVNAGEQIAITATPTTSETFAKYDWGDGTSIGYVEINGTEVTHTFSSAGDYQVRLYSSNDLDGLIVGKSTSMPGLRSVDSWGDVKSKFISFRNATNLISVPTVINAGLVELTEMFYGCTSFNQDISGWDVSGISEFTNMFFGASAFNQPLNNWVTSSAIGFVGMFAGAISFNQDLNGWDVDQVTSFERMFDGAVTFNKPLDSWQTGSVTNTASMFRNASAFNQPIGTWDVDGVTTMTSMFQGTTQATIFNQDISAWNVSAVTNMNMMFKGNIAFNQNLRYWCVSEIAARPFEFTGAGTPITTVNEPRWGLCPIRDVVVTINGLTEPVHINDVRQLTYELNPNTPVQSAVWTSSNEDIAVIDGSGNAIFTGMGQVTISVNINGLYLGSKTITVQDVIQPMTILTTGFNTGTVNVATDSTSGITVDWGDGSPIENIINDIIEHTFTTTDKRLIRIQPVVGVEMPTLHIGGEIEEVVNWYPGTHTGELHLGNMVGSKLLRVPEITPLVVNMSNMFSGCTLFNDPINGWDTSAVTNMTGLFAGATSFNQSLSNWNVSNVTAMDQMFTSAVAFNQDIGGWNVSTTTTMNGMFDGATNFNQDLAWWCVTNIVTEPPFFARNSALSTDHYPTWGTCPSRTYELIIDPVADINVGATAQATYTLTPTITISNVTWSTDNGSVASVDGSGIITGVGEGTTNINIEINHVFTGFIAVTVVQGTSVNEPSSLETHRVVSPTQMSAVVSST
jgi:surface protein